MSYNRLIFFFVFLLFLSCDREDSIAPITDDGFPPAVPSGINVWRQTDGEVGIEWNKVPEAGLDGFNIYRTMGDTSDFSKIGFTKDDYFLDVSLDYDSIYYFKVTAIDIFDRESDFSEIVQAQPINRFKPRTLFDISINARNWYDSISVNLFWSPRDDNDILGYEIYRDTVAGFDTSSANLHGFSLEPQYIDSEDLLLLQQYYYKIVVMDKGGLKSNPSSELTDIIFDRPFTVFPADGEETDYFTHFEITTASLPAQYKIIVQRNEYFDIIKEIDFSSDNRNINILVPITGISLEPYRDYFWRAATYSGNSHDPNSFTELSRFRIVPD